MSSDVFDEYQDSWKDGPFGNADAARENLSSFIEVPNVLDAPENNPRAMRHRVIVGRKGSGKTFYMRMLKDEANRRGILTSGHSETLTTPSVLNFQDEVERYTLKFRRKYVHAVDPKLLNVETWSLCWDRAISLSLISLIRRGESPQLRSLRQSKQYTRLAKELDSFKAMFPKGTRPFPISSCLVHVFDQVGDSHETGDYLSHPNWEQIKQILHDLVRMSPPLSIIIDAIDEDFETAPQAWLSCQAGLFRSIFRTLSYFGEGVSNRVHIIVSLRDIVYAGVLRTEHATRFLDSQYIKFIDWTPGSIRNFLYEKIRRVQEPGKKISSFGDWLSLSTVNNVSRNLVEHLDDYIIRHTRMVPRDIVLMGNAISSIRAENGNVDVSDLKTTVSEIARVLARESMRICVIEALASSSSYVAEILASSGDDFEQSMYDVFFEKFEDLFAVVESESLSKQDFEAAIVTVGLGYEADYAADADPFYRFENIMWRRGLIACKSDVSRNEGWAFNWSRKTDSDLIPSSAQFVGFHSCLIDLYRLRVNSERPIY